MDDQINFTLERIPKETREVTFSDGSVMRVTAPASQFEEWDAEEETDVSSGDEISNTTVLPPAIAESPIHTDTSLADSEQPNIETLTAEIKMYLHIANQSIIEVGKRLIQAKEMLPYGEWKNWLAQNFNLKERMARNFMEVFRRFSERHSNAEVDFLSFNQSQLIAMLALPEGDEEKFIAEKAAEGNPADQMSVKQLKAEVKKWKDEFATSEKSNQGLESYISTLRNELVYYRTELDTTKDHARALSKQLAIQKTVEVPPPDYEDLQREVQELRDRPIEFALPDDYESSKQELAALKAREDSFKHDYTVTHALEQIFSVIPTLLNADNLQNVVSDTAIHDLQSFELHLSQMAKLHSQLQKYLAAWQDDPIYKRPIDRVAIISELKQIIVQDSSTRTSSKIEDLISSLGYKKLLDIPDELLPDLLKKVRNL